MTPRDSVARAFVARYGHPPAHIVRAPGRVNLIGDHTDYNDGFVLPLAIERAVWIALEPRGDRAVHIVSLDLDTETSFRLDDLHRDGAGGWGEYVKGTAWALEQAQYRLNGWHGVLSSDVPIGAGLSSSAALELAAARAFTAVSGIPWEAAAMARLAQRAENDWVGVNCGIMDPLISAAGEADHAVLIDCRSLDTRAVPLPDGSAVVILDTATRRGLVESAYNERRRQCEAAAAFFGVSALRDVTPATIGQRRDGLDATSLRRVRHVVTENARTCAAAAALARADAPAVGALMNASHASLRDDFQVSGPALDAIVEIAQGEDGCHGARMTGAGFGGCAVALVDASRADAFIGAVARAYADRTGLEPHIFATRASAGAAIVE